MGPRASFGQRAGAYLIDIVILNVGLFVLSSLVRTTAASIVLSLGVSLGYFALSEGSTSGQTLGKRAVRIRVVDFETGATITYTRAFARNVGRWLSGIVVGLGYLWMLWDADQQTWHDKIASTTVVRVESLPVERS